MAVKISSVTVPANTSVGVLAAQSQTLGTLIYGVRIYVPSNSHLALADAAGAPPTDPVATMPAVSFPLEIVTRDDVFLFNPGASSVVVTVMSWIRQAA